MSSMTRPPSFRTTLTGSNNTPSRKKTSSSSPAPPLSLSFYNNSNNPLATPNRNDDSNTNSSTPRNAKQKNGYGNYGTPRSGASKNALRPVAVRERSKAIQGCRELKNHRNMDPFSTTISFLITPPSEDNNGKENKAPSQAVMPFRVNVYCDTGTVGTSRVIDGKVRQTFRRNITSLDVVERLLRQPEGPVEIGPSLIGMTDSIEDSSHMNGNKDWTKSDYLKGVELADVGFCILDGEREKLEKHLRQLEEEAAIKAKEHSQLQKDKEQKERQNTPKTAKQSVQQIRSHNPAGKMQAQMLEKAMAAKKTDDSSNGNSTRIGRRRNKFTKLRSRTFHNKEVKKNDGNAITMNNTKRKGGKLAGSNHKPSNSDIARQTALSLANTAFPPKRTNSESNAAAMAASALTRNGSNASNYNEDRNDAHTSSSHHVVSSTKKSTNSTKYNKYNKNSSSFKNCGYEFHFKLPSEVMNQVDQCLRDIAKMNKVVKGVATNGRGTVFLYGNGGVAYTPAIPKALYQKLRQLRSSSYSRRPCYVALGTRDRYFVSFNDGSADWKGSNVFDKVLKKKVIKVQQQASGSAASGNSVSTSRRKSGAMSVVSAANTHHSKDTRDSQSPAALLPRSVAFGATYDTFFIVFHDGSWQYQGRSIPKSLEDKLATRDDADDLVVCNLGPNGEWFLKAENGKMWWSGITPELDSVLKKITAKGYLHNMDFGENGSYFVSYDEE
ncbi:unnamed protein product [Pseudo-nitzschia multistriata]|uniref:Uncharacterized protein n=1 Tax=Pseudo-nitzschia multistriata TaxID=183589 RepID=A0A448ZR71_9STRA|nr:unnamed protein product [Pseudo-nitzschia multistriata]